MDGFILIQITTVIFFVALLFLFSSVAFLFINSLMLLF